MHTAPAAHEEGDHEEDGEEGDVLAPVPVPTAALLQLRVRECTRVPAQLEACMSRTTPGRRRHRCFPRAGARGRGKAKARRARAKVKAGAPSHSLGLRSTVRGVGICARVPALPLRLHRRAPLNLRLNSYPRLRASVFIKSASTSCPHLRASPSKSTSFDRRTICTRFACEMHKCGEVAATAASQVRTGLAARASGGGRRSALVSQQAHPGEREEEGVSPNKRPPRKCKERGMPKKASAQRTPSRVSSACPHVGMSQGASHKSA
ncbi:hypothetical protein B0H13DRAFT_1930342 [Mycena leptocephala]|nr:hypothetical protein B0H13DRAFT_1930342 [Mycena leptocephala]